jgi:crotonobetainyl-CoA:carnitine CoA-transferase CaiB-like acyl-CoA transferase
VVPRFSETPGAVRSAGPSIGQHNDEIYAALGLTSDELVRLRGIGII